MLAWLSHFIGCCPPKKSKPLSEEETLRAHLEHIQKVVQEGTLDSSKNALIIQAFNELSVLNALLGEHRKTSLKNSSTLVLGSTVALDENLLPIAKWHTFPQDNPLICLLTLGLTVPILKEIPFDLLDQLMSFPSQVAILSKRKQRFSETPSLAWLMHPLDAAHPERREFISLEEFQTELFTDTSKKNHPVYRP